MVGSYAYGVHLVQLKHHHAVDHCILIIMNRRVVIGSAERYPLTLSTDILRLFGGDAASNLVVDQVREFVSQD